MRNDFRKIIPGEISREILRAIVYNKKISYQKYVSYVDKDEIRKLEILYKNKYQELGIKLNNGTVKYLPFYHIIKDKIPSFSWEIIKDFAKPKVNIASPRVGGVRVALLNFLVENLDLSADIFCGGRYRCIHGINKEILAALNKYISLANAIHPNEIGMFSLLKWILRGIQGEEITVFIPICPDYAVVPTGNPQCPFRHTFEGVGNGNGQIAKRILETSLYLKQFFSELNIIPNVVVGIADFESFSEENLKRVNLSKNEFLYKINLSRLAFQQEFDLTKKIFMLSELFGGEIEWSQCVHEMKKQFSDNDFGMSGISQKLLLQIAQRRSALYGRWYGAKKSLEEYIPVVLNQGAEYAAMGFFINKLFKNCLIIGADNHVMGHFYNVSGCIPSLFLKRFYC